VPLDAQAVAERIVGSVLQLFEAQSSALRLLEPDAVAPGSTSTHDPSLRLLIAFLGAQRPFTVRILAVEPVRRGLGSPPSREVVAAVDRAAEAFTRAVRSSRAMEYGETHEMGR